MPPTTRSCPTGGPTTLGFDSSPASVEALEKTFAGGGDGDLELVQRYASGDLVVLVGVERQHGPVGGLPESELAVAGDPGVPARGFRLAAGAPARRRSGASDQHGAALSSRTRLGRARLGRSVRPQVGKRAPRGCATRRRRATRRLRLAERGSNLAPHRHVVVNVSACARAEPRVVGTLDQACVEHVQARWANQAARWAVA
jgi:hypothetical protein